MYRIESLEIDVIRGRNLVYNKGGKLVRKRWVDFLINVGRELGNYLENFKLDFYFILCMGKYFK